MAARTKVGQAAPIIGAAPILDGEEELDLTPRAFGKPEPDKAAAAPSLDLTGKPKVWFLRGRGRSGKTMLARWLVEIVAERGGERVVAALDPGRRSLTDFVDGVQQPQTTDAIGVAHYLETLIQYTIDNTTSALIDTGGGDTSVPRLVATAPDLVGMMEGAGVPVVGVYLAGPSPNDLAVLAADVAAGFAPAATLIVCNRGLADPTLDPAVAFARVRAHSVLKAAVSRGAVVLDMPTLDARTNQEIEAKRLPFAAAGAERSPLKPFDAARARFWNKVMMSEFDRVRSWVP